MLSSTDCPAGGGTGIKQSNDTGQYSPFLGGYRGVCDDKLVKFTFDKYVQYKQNVLTKIADILFLERNAMKTVKC